MKHIEDLDDLLDAYLDGNLADLDRKEFEYALANDPALRQRLELFKVERIVGDELIRRDIRRKVKVWSAVHLKEKPKPLPTWKTIVNGPRLSAAAAALVILMSAVYYWDKRAESNPSPATTTTDQKANQANPPENGPVPETTAPLAPNGKGEVKKHAPASPRPIAPTPVEPPPVPTANPEIVVAIAPVPITAETPETALQSKVEALDSQLNASFRGNERKTHIDAREASFREALSFCRVKKYGKAMPLLEKFLLENPDHYLNSEALELVQMLQQVTH